MAFEDSEITFIFIHVKICNLTIHLWLFRVVTSLGVIELFMVNFTCT